VRDLAYRAVSLSGPAGLPYKQALTPFNFNMPSNDEQPNYQRQDRKNMIVKILFIANGIFQYLQTTTKMDNLIKYICLLLLYTKDKTRIELVPFTTVKFVY
jgi:hypothetical protein